MANNSCIKTFSMILKFIKQSDALTSRETKQHEAQLPDDSDNYVIRLNNNEAEQQWKDRYVLMCFLHLPLLLYDCLQIE